MLTQETITTIFVAKTDIRIPTLVGGGWSATIHMVTKAVLGSTIICTTHQTPAEKVEDTTVRMQFPDGEEQIDFETFGRLVASGAIAQIPSK